MAFFLNRAHFGFQVEALAARQNPTPDSKQEASPKEIKPDSYCDTPVPPKVETDLNCCAMFYHNRAARRLNACDRKADAYRDEVKSLQCQLAVEPGNAPTHRKLADFLIWLHDMEGALHHYQLALSLDPKHSGHQATKNVIEFIQEEIRSGRIPESLL